MNEEKDPFAYNYAPGQKIEFEGNALLLMSRFLIEVVERETYSFASFVYSDNTKEIKDDNGKVVKVDNNWKEHTQESFMMTAVDDGGSQLGLTSIGLKASQILSALLNTHEKNIEAKIAKKQETIDEARVFES